MNDLDKQFPDVFLNLEILAEECAEVIKIKSKIIRFGVRHYHPKDQQANINCLVQELGDILALIEILKANGVMKQAELDLAVQVKLNKMPQWYTPNEVEK